MGMPPYPHDIAAELRELRAMVTDAWTAAQSSARRMPYVPMTFAAADISKWPSTASADFTGLWVAVPYRQHPLIRVAVWAYGSTASGSLRIKVGDTYSDSESITDGALVLREFSIPAPGEDLSRANVTVEACRTSGNGTVSCAPVWAYGVES
ncbi:hypothetical protein ACGFNU_01815 [Spirillospora sp. NPDC048911]|uniref:hypothetical protein n=1 Tax=Spirillospora sp. NPDC048911 TaxID=3364527 RepID=UPI00370F9C48